MLQTKPTSTTMLYYNSAVVTEGDVFSICDWRSGLRVDWIYIGEGLSGDWNPNNPNDIPLLRFDVYYLSGEDQWDMVDDGSYCTNMEWGTSSDILARAAMLIIFNMEDKIGKTSYRQALQDLSWMKAEDFK